MSQSISQNAEAIFLAAIELPECERESYVLSRAGNNTELVQEVQTLLEFHQQGSDEPFILDRDLASTCLVPDSSVAIGESVGDTIGPYRLLEQIGEGGMGVVYMAEQKENLSRKVALKIIKLGMDTRNVIARFEAERQAMALFDHPNIARVLDAGATESGRPYFVMELVRGTNIAEFVKKEKLKLVERLRLFISVCHAIQHAHQKGIIHRDLKPSNILVTQLDGNAVPKVIDFGIAKAIGQRLTEKTLFTRYSAMIGTPQYMSPEQAELSGADVDTRSDVYSLGVLLYELITGSTPISKNELSNVNPLELYETLRDAEIETPSLRAARTIDSGAKASVEPILNARYKNELDWVVMKSLARDRSKRYESASELAADVERFLNGDPVLAVPPSRFYRLSRFVAKHRAAVVSATIVSLALLISTVVSGVFAFRSNQLNRDLVIALNEAKKNLNRAETAELELRKKNEEQVYDLAIGMAVSKIMAKASVRFQDLIEEEYRNHEQEHPDQFGPAPFLIEQVNKDEAAGDNESETIVDSEPAPEEEFFMCACFEFDLEKLTEVPLAKEFQLQTDEIRRRIEKVNREDETLATYYDSLYSEDSMVNEEELGHSPFCCRMNERLHESLPELRVEFFRLIVEEYRIQFGENDPRVANGLALLACSLYERKQVNEAEAHLREAIALNTSESKNYKKLLKSFER